MLVELHHVAETLPVLGALEELKQGGLSIHGQDKGGVELGVGELIQKESWICMLASTRGKKQHPLMQGEIHFLIALLNQIVLVDSKLPGTDVEGRQNGTVLLEVVVISGSRVGR